MSVKLYLLGKDELEDVCLDVTHFNIYYNQSRKYEDVFYYLLDVVGFRCHKELWCVITNSARALKYRANGLKIPRDRVVYSGNQQKISAGRMCKLLDRLVELDFLTYYKGGVLSFKNESNVTSVYKFNNKYTTLWEGRELEYKEEGFSCVQLKDRNTNEVIPLVGGRKLVRQMESYNKLLFDTNISLDGVDLPVQQYARIFNDNLTTGGRFYNTIGGVQTMSQQKRSHIEINGEKTVELDFKALHPSILYDQLWQKQPSLVDGWFDTKYDPYDINIDFIPVDSEKVEYIRDTFNPAYNPLRNLVKTVVLVGLNAPTLKSAYLSVASSLYEDKRKYWDTTPEKAKYYGIVIERDSNGGSRFPAKALCEFVQAEHSPISSNFFADKGVELQYVDSEIISRVLTTLIEDNNILLSEHDSVIVKESLADKALVLMKQAYKEVVGSDRFCYIERK